MPAKVSPLQVTQRDENYQESDKKSAISSTERDFATLGRGHGMVKPDLGSN